MAQLQSTSITGSLIVTGGITGSFSGSIASPGSNTQVLFNNSGVISANSGFVYSSGNVGIGTTSPGSKLQVETGADGSVLYLKGTSGNTTDFGFDTIGGYIETNGSSTARQKLRLQTFNGSAYTQLFINGGNENIYTSNNANVGIGTSNPANKFVVSDNGGLGTEFSFYSGESYILSYNRSSGAYTNLNFEASNIFFRSGASATLRGVIDSSGNFGIGTASPSYTLSVSGDISTTGGLRFNGSGLNASDKKLYSPADGDLEWYTNNAAGTHGFAVSNQGTKLVYLNSSGASYLNGGNVGIGTTSPAVKLEVYGGHDDTKARLYSTGNGASIDSSLDMWASEPGLTYDGSGIGNNVNGSPYYGRRNTGLAQSYIRFYSGDILFNTGAGTATQTAVIKSSGRVGIGTTDPLAILSVGNGTLADTNVPIQISSEGTGTQKWIGINKNGSYGLIIGYIENGGLAGNGAYIRQVTSDPLHFLVNSTTAAMTMVSSGNVGIGTTSPETKLQVEETNGGGPGGMLYLKNSIEDSGTFTGIYFGTWGRKSGIFHRQGSYGGYGTGDLIFATNSALNGTVVSPSDAKMTITNPGNVGIGTTNPSAQLSGTKGLSIVDASNAALGLSNGTNHWLNYLSGTTYRIWNNTSSEVMTITLAGLVGIGTTSPAQKLHVIGNTAVTGITSTGDRKLSLGILDLNSGVTPNQIRINTTIPFNSPSADFTVNIKGFRYGAPQMVSLSIGWHYYLGSFYNETAISNGAWKPTISLAQDAGGYVVIHLSSPSYWPKLYVESVYSSAYGDVYSSGWTWTDADLSNCTNVEVVPYQALATDITGNAGSTSAVSGTTNYVAKFTSGTTIGNSQIFDNGTNVGIGTNNPGNRLTIQANNNTYALELRNSLGDTRGGFFYDTTSGTNTSLGLQNSSGTETVLLRTSGVSYLNGGDVGIGTTSPYTTGGTAKLTIAGSILSIGPSNSDMSYIRSLGSGVFQWQTYNSGNTGELHLQPYGGNVGIGTPNPSTKLSVTKGVQSDTINVANSTAYIYGSDVGLIIGQYASGPYGTWLQSIRPDNVTFPLSLNPSGGNVGIGTSSPSARLDIRSSASSGATNAPTFRAFGLDTDSYFQVNNNSNNSADITLTRSDSATMFSVDGHTGTTYFAGDVGIGTTNPQSKLHIIGALRLFKDGSNSIADSGVYIANAANSRAYNLQLDSSGDSLNLYTFGGSTWENKVTFNANGNVGIGTTSSPGNRLIVSQDTGYTNENTYTIAAAASTNTAYKTIIGYDYGQDVGVISAVAAGIAWKNLSLVPNGGNVGIGTISPSYKLDVNGTGRFPIVIVGTSTVNSGNTKIQIASTAAGNKLGFSGGANFITEENLYVWDFTTGASAGISFQYNGVVNATTFVGALSGNATTATNLSTNRTNWNTNGTISAVVGQLAWKNYGNNHTIFDASNSTAPNGGAISNTNPDVAWTSTYPTLMGWNGSNTYGVRVDSARTADSTSAVSGTTNYVAKFTSGTAIGNSLMYDDGTSISVGTTSAQLATSGRGNITINGSSQSILVLGNGGSWKSYLYNDGTNTTLGTTGDFSVATNNGGTTTLYANTSGNVGIGSTSPSNKLFISAGVGTAAFNKGITILTGDSTFTTGHGGMLQFQNEDVITAGIRGVRESGWGSGLAFYVHNTSAGNTFGSTFVERMRINESGNVGIGTSTPGATLEVVGSFRATTKSFIIDHPTKEGKKLQYGVLEGPEHSVYVRGKLTNTHRIELPDYWHALVDEDTITVNLTAIGRKQELWVEEITDKYIMVGSETAIINCFYTVFAERKDVEKLVTEFDKE